MLQRSNDPRHPTNFSWTVSAVSHVTLPNSLGTGTWAIFEAMANHIINPTTPRAVGETQVTRKYEDVIKAWLMTSAEASFRFNTARHLGAQCGPFVCQFSGGDQFITRWGVMSGRERDALYAAQKRSGVVSFPERVPGVFDPDGARLKEMRAQVCAQYHAERLVEKQRLWLLEHVRTLDVALWRVWVKPAEMQETTFEEQMGYFSNMFTPRVDVVHSFDFTGLSSVVEGASRAIEGLLIAATGGEGVAGKTVRHMLSGLVPMALLGVAVMYCKAPMAMVLSAFKTAGFTVASFFPDSSMEPQFGENNECGTFAKMALAAIGGWMIGSQKAVNQFVIFISKSAPFIIGATTITEAFMEFVQWLVNKLLHFASREPVEFFTKRSKQVTAWILDTRRELASGADDVGKAERIVQLYKLGMELKAEYALTPAISEIERVFRELDSVYVNSSAAIAQMRSSRSEPLAVILRGDPGTGKSNMISMLHGYVMALAFPNEVKDLLARGLDTDCMKYQKDTGKFWAGYDATRHRTLVIDDAGTALPAVGAADNDFMTFMRCINTSSCPLEMASISDKGVTYFRSELILATTNMVKERWLHYASMVMTNPEAITRRMRMFVTVTVKPGRTSHDGIKIAPEWCDKDDSWMLEVVEDGKPDILFGNLKDFARHIVAEMRRRNTIYRNLRGAVETGIRQLLEEGDVVVNPVADAVPQMRDFEDGSEGPSAGSYYYRVCTRAWNWFNLGQYMTACDEHAKAKAAGEKWANEMIVYLGKLCKVSYSWLTPLMSLTSVLAAVAAVVGGLLVKTGWSLFTKKAKRETLVVVPEFASDEQAEEEMRHKIIKNSYTISLMRGCETVASDCGNILFVDKRYAVMPNHYFRHFAKWIAHYHDELDHMWVKFTNASGAHFLEPLSRFNSVAEMGGYCKCDVDGVFEDAVLVALNTHEHTSLVGRFISKADTVKDIHQFFVTKCNPDGVDRTLVEGRFDGPLKYAPANDPHEFNRIQMRAQYTIENRTGDCGSVVTLLGRPFGGRKIVGIHVAGSSSKKTGVAIVLTDEWLASALITVRTVKYNMTSTEDSVVPAVFDPQINSGDLDECITHKITVRTNVSKSMDINSMVPSAMIGWAPISEIPSDCSFPSVRRGLEAYTEKPVVTGEYGELYEAAATAALNSSRCPHKLNNRMLTIAEALSGMCQHGRFAEPVNHTTSPGFPMMNSGMPKSKLWCTRTGELKVDSMAYRVLVSDVKALENRLIAGQNILSIFQVSPKPELRKPGKLPRIIQGAPLALVVVWRKFFWSFMLHYASWTPEKEAVIGLNPYCDWPDLARYLSPAGVHEFCVGAGDYSKFDQSHEPAISRAIGRAVITRYGDDGMTRARALLWQDLCGVHVTFGHMVYKLPKGLPSGHPGTALVNSLYNMTLFRLAYASVHLKDDAGPFGFAPSRAVILFSRFSDRVKLAVLGDDNIFGSADPEFNEMVLPDIMKQFGATYTLDTKEGQAVTPFRSLSEVTFIGRHFYYDPRERVVLPSLRQKSVFRCGQYALKENQLTEAWYESTLRSVLYELSYHPQSFWDEWAPVAYFKWGERRSASVSLIGVSPGPKSRLRWREEHMKSDEFRLNFMK